MNLTCLWTERRKLGRHKVLQNTIHIPTHFLYGNPNSLIFYLCKYVFVFYDFGILQL